MATRLTYTTGSRSPELDRAFEAALADARGLEAEPLEHLVVGRDSTAGEPFAREDPSRRDQVASRAHEGAELAAGAVETARAAQREWRRLRHSERVELLRGAERLIDERKLAFAAAISMEVGKVRTESIAEVEEAIDLIETYCRQVESADGFETPLGRLSPDERNSDVLRPYGVFAVIAPFNFPFALAMGMTAAALVAGNSVVLKPPEEAPASGGAVGRLLAETGVPEGVISVLHGGPATGEALVGSAIDGVAFTGSAEVGREIGRRLAQGPYPRPVLAEMGGKNAAVVGASADLDAAAEGIANAAFGFSGQKCSACSRAIVVEEVHDELVERLAELARATAVGDPADPEVATGPVVNEQALERFQRSVEAARRDGAVAAGGARAGEAGWFVEPTVVSGLPLGHPLTREELFLPFVTVVRVPDFDAALTEANAVPYGLTAGVFSRDEDELDRFLDEIESGVVYVNRRAGATTGAWPGVQSFCGWKSSGLTGKGGLGPYYVQQFAREQSRTIVEQ
ncbi:MAG TPA: aldehyde dehydrogenase family protein [Gaiellaceae bacterium]